MGFDEDYNLWKFKDRQFWEISKHKRGSYYSYNLTKFIVQIAPDLPKEVRPYYDPRFGEEANFFEIDNHFIVQNKYKSVLGVKEEINSADNLAYEYILNKAKEKQESEPYIPLKDRTAKGKKRLEKLEVELLYKKFKIISSEDVQKFL